MVTIVLIGWESSGEKVQENETKSTDSCFEQSQTLIFWDKYEFKVNTRV